MLHTYSKYLYIVNTQELSHALALFALSQHKNRREANDQTVNTRRNIRARIQLHKYTCTSTHTIEFTWALPSGGGGADCLTLECKMRYVCAACTTRAKVQRRLKCDTAGALPFIHWQTASAVLPSYPRNIKKQSWQKTAAKKQRNDTNVERGKKQ